MDVSPSPTNTPDPFAFIKDARWIADVDGLASSPVVTEATRVDTGLVFRRRGEEVALGHLPGHRHDGDVRAGRPFLRVAGGIEDAFTAAQELIRREHGVSGNIGTLPPAYAVGQAANGSSFIVSLREYVRTPGKERLVEERGDFLPPRFGTRHTDLRPATDRVFGVVVPVYAGPGDGLAMKIHLVDVVTERFDHPMP